MKQAQLEKPSIRQTQLMLKIGITGGIGSGKTTVCKLFETLGIPVYYADERAKYLMQHEHFLIDQLKKNFGDEVYENGRLNRALLAEKVFNNKPKLELLNSIVHPAVYRDTERWVEEQKIKKPPYLIKEAALLIETGSYNSLDKLIMVTAPLEQRINRVSARDKISVEDVMARVRNQLPEDEKIKLADFIITNDGDIANLEKQVAEVHQQILNSLNQT